MTSEVWAMVSRAEVNLKEALEHKVTNDERDTIEYIRAYISEFLFDNPANDVEE